MCLRQSWKEPFGDMEMENFQRLLPSFPQLGSLNLSGYGEPFLNPHLIDMILQARKCLPSSARIELTSNGTLLFGNLVRDVIKAGLDSVTISIDSLDRNQFQTIRQGGDLHTVIKCLETLLRVREKVKERPFLVNIAVVAMERNLHELPHLVRFAVDLHLNGVWINNVLPPTEDIAREVLYSPNSDEVLELFGSVKEKFYKLGVDPQTFPRLVQRFISLSPSSGLTLSRNLNDREKELLEIYHEAVLKGLSAGAEFNLVNLLKKDKGNRDEYLDIFSECEIIAISSNLELYLPSLIPRTRRECSFIKNENCFITWDGWVRPCYQCSHEYICFHHGRRKRAKSISFGKVPENSLDNIWKSEPYRKFRQIVEEFSFPDCTDCGVANSCGLISPDLEFFYDCFGYEYPCGDCLWSQGILQCPS
jgi:putative metalloenzyme radical SAM/SPASM domain maturase